MTHKVGSLQSAAEADFKTCCQHVDTLRDLKGSDPKAYKRAIKELQAVARGERPNSRDLITAEMADTVLTELDEYGHIVREDVAEVLRSEPGLEEEAFMGDSDMFVPVADAVSNREIPADCL